MNDELGRGIQNMPDLIKTLFPDEAFAIAPKFVLAAMPVSMYDRKTGKWTSRPDFDLQGKEQEVATFFNNIIHVAETCYRLKGKDIPGNETRRWSADCTNNILPGGPTPRKPDLFLIPEGEPQEWKNVLAAGQIKSEAHAIVKIERQLQDSAYNCFATQDDLMSHIEIGLVLDRFWVTVFDRAGCVHSFRGNVDEDASYLVRVIVGLALLDRSRLGYDPSVKTLSDGRRAIAVNDVTYQILETLFISDVLRGRGTVCWHCRPLGEERDDDDVVIKSLWADQSRLHTEADFLRIAGNIKGISTLVAEEAVMEGDKPRSTTTIRQALCDHDREDEFNAIEVRHHYRLVLKPFGIHVEHFASKKELLSVLKDCIEAHEKLVYERHVLHSDISDNNVMIRAKGEENGLRKGLLIDLDYASLIGQKRNRTAIAHRTGTLPFMAWEILKYGDEIPHEPRHDLESFLYVLIWTCVCYAGPNCTYRKDFDVMQTRLARWLDLTALMSEIGGAKNEIMCFPTKDTVADKFPEFLDEVFDPYFEDLKPCVRELREIIFGEEFTDPRQMHVEVREILQRHIDKLSHPDSDPAIDQRMGAPYMRPKKVAGTKRTAGRADGVPEFIREQVDDVELQEAEEFAGLITLPPQTTSQTNSAAPSGAPGSAQAPIPAEAPALRPIRPLRGARGSSLSDAAIVGRLRTSGEAGVLHSYNEDVLERERERRQGSSYRSNGSETKRQKLL